MKVQELLSEAISLSTWIHDIHNKLAEIGDHHIMDGEMIAKYNRYFMLGMTDGRVTELVKTFVNEVHYVIEQSYSAICSDLIGTPVKVHLRPTELNSGVGGSAGYNNINLFIDKDSIVKSDIYKVMDRIYNTESFDNDSKLSNKHELIDVLKDCRIWDFRLYDAIVEPHRIDTMVHELVHITQHSKQSGIRNVKGKPVFGTEYRSKVEPNLAKFYNAIRNVSDGTATPEDYKIYTSSLQEIPAHAHNAAIDIFRAIDFDWSGKVDNYTQKQLHTLVAVIKQLPRGPSTIVDDNGRLIDSPRLDHYNTAFNHPEDKKLYQVYKRFIKILHQELVNYAQYWINKLKEVEDYK